jgi:BON domain
MAPFSRILLTATLLTAAPAFAGDLPAPPTGEEDAQLNRLAYSALQRNPDLADVNIGVRVLRGGTAVLWGTATKADAAKAEAVLKTLPGITAVSNTCDSAGASDPLVARVEAAAKAPVPPVEPTKPAPAKAEVVKSDLPKPAADSPPLPGPPGAAVSRHTTTVEKPRVALSPSPEPATRLLDPIAASPPVDYAAVERIRRSDARYARLTFDLRDGRVVIGGSAADAAVAWEMARKIAPLVGDRDVVVGRVKVQ